LKPDAVPVAGEFTAVGIEGEGAEGSYAVVVETGRSHNFRQAAAQKSDQPALQALMFRQ
jgi:hypothetical protein